MSDGRRPALRRAAASIGSAPYLLRWLVIAPVIGAVGGAGVLALWNGLLACTHLFLSTLAGYHVPTTARQGAAPGSSAMVRPWALPLVVGLGALIGSLLVVCFAPEESEGNGTDAAIATCHTSPRTVRIRAVVIRLIASAFTIGSGGSGGQAGPSGHIGAGVASWLSRALGLNDRDARVAVATGIGSAIGAILGAPIGGAVLGAEILYRDGLDAAVLFPCALASGTGYLVFGAAEGFGPLFGHVAYHFAVAQLGWFALIGLLGGVIGLLYAKGFYGIAALFERSPLPGWLNPVAGGVLVGAIAIGIPEVLGPGLGWVQRSLGASLLSIPLWIVVLLPFARIVTTGLSVGSGGSGGVFAPGIVMGAFIGASVWRVFEPHVASMGHDPAPYVIVGMMACLGAISRAPIAVALMAAEMTGGLGILLPAALAVVVAWAIVGLSGDTIYRSQLPVRAGLLG